MTALVVLGMHRSGTSAMAGLLAQLGVDFGERLMPGAADNPKGYWEHPRIVEMNDRLLRALDSVWHDSGLWSEGWWLEPDLAPIQRLLVEILQQDLAAAPLWGLKDPRLCRLLPAWEPVFRDLHCEPRYVIVLRHPHEVAASLHRRDGFSRTKSLLLWLQYLLEAERWTRERPRVLVSYDELCTDWRPVAGRIGTLAGQVWEEYTESVVTAIDAFLSPSLRHHRAESVPYAAAAGPVEATVHEVHRLLRETANGKETGPELDELRRQLLELVSGLAPAARMLGRVVTRGCAAAPSTSLQAAAESATESEENTLPTVDVIVPVYRGVEETRACIDSVLEASQRTPFELIVVDDHSPEPLLAAYLDELAKRPGIRLLRNPENLGFAGAVNRGMSVHPDRDVVLLNSDTRVAGDWLDRLRRCAGRDPRIATVTPFSNNATITSYPRFMEDNPLPEGWDLESLDALFREVNAGGYENIPTGVGFCLYIRRAALVDLGLFDTHTFRAGYGEENDFCMRAWKRNWRNVVACDTFVWHHGGVSFEARRHALQDAATSALVAIHPEYAPLAQQFIADDPLHSWRLRVDAARARHSLQQALTVVGEWQREMLDLHRRQQEATRQCRQAHREQALAHAERLLEEARETLVERDRALAMAESFVRQREADVTQLQQQLTAVQTELNQLRRVREELAAVYASRSWRYTTLFRKLRV